MKTTPEMLASFLIAPHFIEVAGPGTLVRLVQFRKTNWGGLRWGSSRRDGLFWFEADLLIRAAI
jgi:hypothetical protein